MLPFGQFKFDATVTLVSFFGLSKVNWLKFAKAGGDQTLWRYAFADEILDHRDCARSRQIPIRFECAAN